MSTTTGPHQDQQPVQPSPPRPGTDPVTALLAGIVVGLALALTGYACFVHPTLAASVGAMATMASALITAIGIALARPRQ
ncbi:hypothetical protein [Streptomyces sp. enrichment culture]|uniref:hypothetical protein n=1 Tax=Streptomyces sp. enrichment culture TaxID=1795815 RepID=UPI003F55024A